MTDPEWKAEVERIETTVRAKAVAMAPRAIGQPYAVRQDRNTVVRGTITDCKFSRIGWHGQTARAVWHITINGLFSFKVSTIPAR
jgi:hypothetical protein